MIWGPNFTNDKTQRTLCLETSVDIVDFMSGLVMKVILLYNSAHCDVLGAGNRINRIIYLE